MTGRSYETTSSRSKTLDSGTLNVPAGSGQTTTVTGLSPYVTYYLALKAVDDWGNTSSMSNVTSAQTCDACTESFCKAWGEASYKRCTFNDTCGYEGCCRYTCVVPSLTTEN